LERDVRVEAKEALNIIRTDIKNLEEIAPIIPDDIIDAYKLKYPRHDGEHIKRPNITNGLTEIIVNKPEILVVKADLVIPQNVNNQGVEIIDVDGLM
jgi:putative NADH-flavin reductase